MLRLPQHMSSLDKPEAKAWTGTYKKQTTSIPSDKK